MLLKLNIEKEIVYNSQLFKLSNKNSHTYAFIKIPLEPLAAICSIFSTKNTQSISER